MYCSKCGEKNPDDATYCYNCGAPLINENHADTIQTKKPETIDEKNNHPLNQDGFCLTETGTVEARMKSNNNSSDKAVNTKKHMPIILILTIVVGCAVGLYFMISNLPSRQKKLSFKHIEDIQNEFSKVDAGLVTKINNPGTDIELKFKANEDESIKCFGCIENDAYKLFPFPSSEIIPQFEISTDNYNSSYQMTIYYLPEGGGDSEECIVVHIAKDIDEEFYFSILDQSMTKINFLLAFSNDGTLDTKKMKDNIINNNIVISYPGMNEENFDRLIGALNESLNKGGLSVRDFVDPDDLKYYVCDYNPEK